MSAQGVVAGPALDDDAGTPPVVEIEGLVKDYPGPVRVLGGVDLVVRRGELAAIVGPSGSGKSTLLHILGTLDRPTSGTVRVAGRDVGSLPEAELAAFRAHEIGFVFQQFFLLEGLSAVENVANALLYRGIAPRRRIAAATDALVRLGLAHRLHQSPSKLSGGERQRVAIARAVVGEPSLILADEPTGNLDSASGAQIMSLLADLNVAGRTVLVITHDRDIAASLPRRIEIRDGLIVADERGVRDGR